MNVEVSIVGTPQIMKMDDNTYFNDPKYKDLISNSRLSLLNPEQGGSTDLFLKGFGPQEYNQYFMIGSAVHDLKLQPEAFRLSHVNAPSGKMLAFCNYFIKRNLREGLSDEDISDAILAIGYKGFVPTQAKIEFIRSQCESFVKLCLEDDADESITQIRLSKTDEKTVKGCLDALKNSKEIDDIFNPDIELISGDYNEFAIFIDVRVIVDGKSTVLKLKGKIDRFIAIDHDAYVYDLKTSSHTASQFKLSMERYHYYRQAAFYKMLLSAVGYKVKSFKFVVVSTMDYSTRVYPVSDFKRGQDELLRLLGLSALIKMNYHHKQLFSEYSLRSLATTFTAKMKLISLLCFLLQKFRKNDKDFTVKQLIQRIRKDKIGGTSGAMIDKLSVWVEDFYFENETYPTFKLESAKEMSAYINEILDKELPFETSDYENDLPF